MGERIAREDIPEGVRWEYPSSAAYSQAMGHNQEAGGDVAAYSRDKPADPLADRASGDLSANLAVYSQREMILANPANGDFVPCQPASFRPDEFPVIIIQVGQVQVKAREETCASAFAM